MNSAARSSGRKSNSPPWRRTVRSRNPRRSSRSSSGGSWYAGSGSTSFLTAQRLFSSNVKDDTPAVHTFRKEVHTSTNPLSFLSKRNFSTSKDNTDTKSSDLDVEKFRFGCPSKELFFYQSLSKTGKKWIKKLNSEGPITESTPGTFKKNHPPCTFLNLPSTGANNELISLVWHKQEGDAITEGDVVAQVQTKKGYLGKDRKERVVKIFPSSCISETSIVSNENGYLAKQLMPTLDHDTLWMCDDTPIAVVVKKQSDIPAFVNLTTIHNNVRTTTEDQLFGKIRKVEKTIKEEFEENSKSQQWSSVALMVFIPCFVNDTSPYPGIILLLFISAINSRS